MSRIGKQPVVIPEGLTVDIGSKQIEISGPNGSLSQQIFDGFKITQKEGNLNIAKTVDNVSTQEKYGLLRTLINNMVIGVSKGFKKTLEVKGVGYKAQMDGNGLSLSLGFSHKIVYNPPEGITLKVEGNKIIVSGFDKQAVGETS
ncbi:MAG: 50S ribosomal protein L6, partial [bacterium]|nr:50S ribosomal protein L6 [bacterium]